MKKIAIILLLLKLTSCVSIADADNYWAEKELREKTRKENNKTEIMSYAMQDCRNLKKVNEAELTDSPFQRCVVRRAVANGYLE